MAKVVFSLTIFFLLLGTLRVPATVLSGVICMFAIEQWLQASDVFFVQKSSLVNLTVGILVVTAVIVSFFQGAKLVYRYPSVAWVTVLLFLYAFISLAWVSRLDIALVEWKERAPYVITLVLLTPLLVSRIEDFRRVFFSTLLLGTLVTTLLLFTVKWEYRSIVLAGSSYSYKYGNPLVPAELAGTVTFIALFYRFQKGRVVWGAFKWLLVAACLFLIIRSGSRGQLLALFLALLVGWPLSRNIKGFSGIFFSLAGLSGVGIISMWILKAFLSGDLGGGVDKPFFAEAMQDRWSENAMQESMGGRLSQTVLLLSYWLRSPISILFGLGNSTSFDPNVLGIYPHFIPGEILAEEGIIGLVLYFCILFLSIKNTRSAYGAVKDDDQQRGLLAIVVSVLVYSFFLSLKQGSMLGNLPFFLWAILLGRFERAVTAVPRRVDGMCIRTGIAATSDNRVAPGGL